MSRTFLCYINKDDLVSSLQKFGLDIEGNVDELRTRFRKYLDSEDIPPEHDKIIQQLREKYEAPPKDVRLTVKGTRATSPSPPLLLESDANVCDRVRKWGIKYDGGKDPLGFLERIEELAACYSIAKDTLLNFMPELFKGDALLWYRNNKNNWKLYADFVADFKLFYLPDRFFENLDDDIRNRIQKPRERFVDYVTAIQSLMRWTNMTSRAQLDRIFRNCRAEYKFYIKPHAFSKLQDLISLAQEYESIRSEEMSQNNSVPRRIQTVVGPTNRNCVCYRCGEPGHTRVNCSNAQVLFCWDCGKKGVKTIDCCRPLTGNARGDPSVREEEVDL